MHTGCNEARCHACMGYTDDCVAVLNMGADATVRYCAKHGRHFGPNGCNIAMAIAAKRSIGVCVSFVGALALSVGQLACVTREKTLRTLAVLDAAAAGELALSEWVKLTGLLNHTWCAS